MATQEYDWHPAPNQGSVFKVESRNLGWWVLLAILVSIIVHVVLYLVLGGIQRSRAGLNNDIVHRNILTDGPPIIPEERLNELLNEFDEPVIPEEIPDKPEKLSEMDTLDKTLDEFDLLEKLKDEPIRMAPVDSAQIFSTEAPQIPKQALDVAADSMNISVSEVLAQDLGRHEKQADRFLQSSCRDSGSDEARSGRGPEPGTEYRSIFERCRQKGVRE